jgi:hypothetical protein
MRTTKQPDRTHPLISGLVVAGLFAFTVACAYYSALPEHATESPAAMANQSRYEYCMGLAAERQAWAAESLSNGNVTAWANWMGCSTHWLDEAGFWKGVDAR